MVNRSASKWGRGARAVPSGMPVALWGVLILVMVVAGCGEPEVAWRSPVAFDTARVQVTNGSDTSELLVEVAETGEQRAFGLMVRPSLDPGSGMIFLHDSIQPDSSTFWMWRTRMPLDIAFMDSTGTILSVLQMQPCESPYQQDCLPGYGPGVEYSSALETNEGWFREHGFGVGDRVILDRE